MADTPHDVANDPRAPDGERFDAQAALQKAHMPSASDLIPSAAVQQLIEYANGQLEEERLIKASNVVQFPGSRVRARKDGMQSVFIDEMQVSVMGDYYERPGTLPFEAMRLMCDQTPVLAGVILTRCRQVMRFCTVLEQDDGPGFNIRHRDKDHQASNAEKEEIKNLQRFITNCGWEFNPRERRQLDTCLGQTVKAGISVHPNWLSAEPHTRRQVRSAGGQVYTGTAPTVCANVCRSDDFRFHLSADPRIKAPRSQRTGHRDGVHRKASRTQVR